METAHKTEEEKREYFDPEDILDKKIEELANMIKTSKHFIAFTGAGISTSAGIPDFRSGVKTVLPTGPGAWEKLATKAQTTGKIRTSMQQAIPTKTHMALVKLEKEGLLKFLISQNTDGLHRKSGFPASRLSEVHGNTNLEICKSKNCKKQYMRDFRTRTAQKVHDHKTGRKCENCGGDLYDSIINFGENLPDEELTNGFGNARKADLCLALGSSLRVTPAADMPLDVAKHGGKLVIVNLQKTPLDDYALCIHALIDDVINKLMAKLQLEIPPFILTRRLGIRIDEGNPNDKTIKGKRGIVLRGLDAAGSPYSIFPKIESFLTATKESFTLTKEPMKICSTQSDYKSGKLEATLNFQGHYQEPTLKVDIPMSSLSKSYETVMIMEYDPKVRKWINCFEKPRTAISN